MRKTKNHWKKKTANPLFLVFVASALFSYCGNKIVSQDLIDAEFLTTGQSAIDLSVPANNTSTGQNPLFAWSTKPGITAYQLEISATADFSQIVLSKTVSGNSYTLANSDLTGISQLDATQYYWRVSVAKFHTNLQSNTYSIHVVDSTNYYVNGASGAATQYGNKSSPFKLLQVAINAASAARSSSNTNMIIRVASGTYVENIYMKAGVSIYGGYEATAWTRNTSANTTTITASSNIGIYAGSDITSLFTASTVADGFTINGGSSAGASNYGIYIINGNPTISNNSVNGSSCTISGDCYGIYVSGASPVISGNSIRGGSQTSNLFATYGIYNTNTATPVITNNAVNAGTNSGTNAGASNTYGIHSTNASLPTISNNTINGGGASSGIAYGIFHSFTGTSIVTNNIIFTTSGGQRFGIYESGVSTGALSLQNNLLFDCPTALYYDQTTLTNHTTEAAINNPANTTQGTAASSSGNLGPASVANFAAVFFTSASDLRLTSSSPLNVRCGGKDTSQNSCGAAGSASCGSVSKDFDSLLRTTGLSGTCTGASNTGAAGYSIGAYEKD